MAQKVQTPTDKVNLFLPLILALANYKLGITLSVSQLCNMGYNCLFTVEDLFSNAIN